MKKKSLIYKSLIAVIIFVVAFSAAGCFVLDKNTGNSRFYDSINDVGYYIANPDFALSYSADDKLRIDEKMAKTEKLLTEGSDYARFEQVFEDVVITEAEYLSEQMRIAEIFTYLYQDDKKTLDSYDEIVDYINTVSDWENAMYVGIRDSAYKEKYYEGMTDEEIDDFIGESDVVNEYLDLYFDGIALENEYYALSESEFYEKTPEIYAKVVENNQKIAKLFGYENYVDCAYENEYEREYTAEDIDVFTDYLIAYILPVYLELSEKIDTVWWGMIDSQFAVFSDAVYDINFDILDAFFKEMGFDETFDKLFNEGNMIVSTLDSSYETAFVSEISDRVSPVMYIGPDYIYNTTFVHEFGHYYDAIQNSTSDYDLAETHSQGDEAMFWAWMLNNSLTGYDADVEKYKELIVDYYLYEATNTVLLASIVDSFEQYVYTHDLLPSEYDDAMKTVCERYGGYYEISMLLGVDIMEYWRSVVVTNPCYYISYSVSMVSALQIYCKAKDDFNAAKDSYLRLFDYESGQTYTQILYNAGLLSPFDDELYATFEDMI